MRILKLSFFQFYKKLFFSKGNSPTYLLAKGKCKALIPNKISYGEDNSLNNPISVEEIYKAIKALNNNKVPKSDGLPVEFYKSGID